MTQPERNRRTGQGSTNPPRPVYDTLPERRLAQRAIAALFVDTPDGEVLVTDAESPAGIAPSTGIPLDAITETATTITAPTGGEYVLLHDGTEWQKAQPANLVNVVLPSGEGGELLYHDGSGWVVIAAGNEGDVLTMVSGIPTWQAPAP